MEKRAALRGQAVMDYIVILGLALAITLVVLGLSNGLPGIGTSLQSNSQLAFWHYQARPMVVPDAYYRTSTSRFYIAMDVMEDDVFNLTGVFINGTQYAFYTYSSSALDGTGTLVCGSATCQVTPCSCDLTLKTEQSASIVTEPSATPTAVCGFTQQLTPLTLQLVYFRASDPTRNLTETGPVVVPFRCQS